MNSLQDKVAFVTGAGSGMGAAVARKLAAGGVKALVLADRDEMAVTAVAQLIGAEPVGVDVADADQVDRAFGELVARHGRPDVVVHAAGVDDPDAKQLMADALTVGEPVDITAGLAVESWRRVMSVNLDGTFYVLRAALRAMMPNRAGSVVLIGSSSVFDAPAGYPHYSASKAGVHALAQSVAKEAIAFGIRVNVVAPGPTDTGMAARTPEVLRQDLADPRVRPYATPDEIADVALFLASEAAANLVGAVLLANGGRFTR